MSNSDTEPNTPPPSTTRTMAGTPSFVWVKSPRSSATHQAELLQIREDGYLVKWSISGKQELISSESKLEQELPTRRTRRRSSIMTDVDSDDGEEPREVKKESSETPMLVESKSKSRAGKKSKLEDEDYVDTEPRKRKKKTKEPVDKGTKKTFWKLQKRTSDGKFSSKKAPVNTQNRRSNATESPPPPQSTMGSTKTNHPKPEQCINLFKLHRLVRTKTEDSVARVLEPQGYALAVPLVTEFFLFCHERQSCWERRNNEENPIWSESAIFQNYSFANVCRELDRGTCYIRSQFAQYLLDTQNKNSAAAAAKDSNTTTTGAPKKRKPFSGKVRRRDWIQQLLWTSYCYRQVNVMESFTAFGGAIPRLSELDRYLEYLDQIESANEDAEELFFTSIYHTPTFEEYRFHLQQLNQANGWLLKHVAGRLAQCKSLGACWDQIYTRLPGMLQYPDIAWQVLCDLLESGCLLVGPHDLPSIDFLYLEESSERILSGCWKDRQVDATQALELMKLLTAQQQEIFKAIGVTFPSWADRPLAIKDLAHALGQYAKYVKIQADIKKQTPEENRLLISKSYLDTIKPCRFCEQYVDLGLLCDACLCFYCKDCEPESYAALPKYWLCSPCKDLDRLQYTD